MGSDRGWDMVQENTGGTITALRYHSDECKINTQTEECVCGREWRQGTGGELTVEKLS